MARRSYKRALVTQKDGHQLAADMLRAIHTEWTKNEKFQRNGNFAILSGDAVRRFLEIVRTSGNPALKRGFYSALTDYIGSCVDGMVPSPEHYEPH